MSPNPDNHRRVIFILFLITIPTLAICQIDSAMQQADRQLSKRGLTSIENTYASLTDKIEQKTQKLLAGMLKKEKKMREQLSKTDSSKAKEVFGSAEQTYQSFQSQLQQPASEIASKSLNEYIPKLDSLQTAMKFLRQAGVHLPEGKLEQIGVIGDELKNLQGRLQQANAVQAFVRERSKQLKAQLMQFGFGKQLQGIHKEVYYYQQQLAEYKQLLKDPKKIEQKAIAIVHELPAFKKFWQKNSYLAQLFRMPSADPATETFEGLQTRNQVAGMVGERLYAAGVSSNPSGAGTQSYVQNQVQVPNGALDQLKNKLNELGGGNSDMTMPEFKPNPNKTKSFMQRLEYGLSIQTTGTTNYLPTTTEIALMLGYKFTPKVIAGIGTSYKLGLGKNWSNIQISNQGIGFRTYLDVKAKGSFWLTGGFEYNYLHEFKKFDNVPSPFGLGVPLWQRSALAGLTKKYKIGKSKEGKIQLLYDFLAPQQVPKAQALKFRLGYSF